MVSSLPPRIERNRGNRAIRAISFRLHSRKRNNRIRERRRRDSTDGRTDGRPTSIHSTHDRQRVRNCFMGVPLSLDCDCLDCPSPFLPYCVQNPRSLWRLARLRKVTVLRSPLLFDSSRVMCGGHGDGGINRRREGGLDKGAQIPGRTHMTQQGGREKGKSASVDIGYSDSEVKVTDICILWP